MRKGLLWTLLGLLIVILMLPLAMGLVAKKQFYEIVTSIRETQGIVINVEKYQFS